MNKEDREFKIIETISCEDLENKVKAATQEGWVPYCPPTFHSDPLDFETHGILCIQPIIKFPKDVINNENFQYKIIETTSCEDLENMVNAAMQEGWELYDYPSYIFGFLTPDFRCIQAMIKYTEDCNLF